MGFFVQMIGSFTLLMATVGEILRRTAQGRRLVSVLLLGRTYRTVTIHDSTLLHPLCSYVAYVLTFNSTVPRCPSQGEDIQHPDQDA